MSSRNVPRNDRLDNFIGRHQQMRRKDYYMPYPLHQTGKTTYHNSGSQSCDI